MTRRFANVALSLPSTEPFQYSIPEDLLNRAQVGVRVFANVRARRMVGYVVDLTETQAFDNVRDIEGVIDDEPLIPPAMLELTRWLAETYFCSWGQALETAMPAPFKKGRFLMKARTARRQYARHDGNSSLPLTAHQDAAFQRILTFVKSRESKTFLLHGITGSGKTEVYLRLVQQLLSEDRGSIILVPEISLTPQTVERFASRFGDSVAVIHSRLSQARRVEEWHRIRSGQARVVVGARSAVFSPVQNLGLIVIDEEHDTSYKQDETPRYHTRTVAAKRCELESAVLVVGSATPSLESYWESETGRIERLELPERIEKRPLPAVEIVDMRREFQGNKERIFSSVLEKRIQDSLSKKEQVMIFLNRRGFSTYLHCPSCGYVMTCPNCRVSLTYHFDKHVAMCHICHHKDTAHKLCPGCQKNYLHYFGIGTQKVEGEALRLFGGARVGRMDADSTAHKDAHETILESFKRGDIDLLIGTQMIAKGHDFPNVSLIGIISADTALHIPDFRAAERTFCLLTQVAGRAGRGNIPGKVIVQTYVPHHYAIQSTKDHNYREFYDKEIEFRKELAMPPVTCLAVLVGSSTDEKELLRHLTVLARAFQAADPQALKILGPAPCLISKERGKFRWNIFVRDTTFESLRSRIKAVLTANRSSKVQVTVDMDPQ